MAKRYWRGFAAGAAAGAGLTFGSVALVSAFTRRNPYVVRMEKSIQVGRPQEEVFQGWANLEKLSRWSDCIEDISTTGDRSHWRVKVDGRILEWDAEIEQFIPNQAIGWKSINGPKHTGRITFAPIGDDTLVQITMNYMPPSRLLKPFSPNMAELMERYIDQALRDFKASLEGKGQEGATPANRTNPDRIGNIAATQSETRRATGTYGSPTPNSEVDRFGSRPNPVEYTSPPEMKR